MLLHALDSQPGEVIAPRPDDARRDACIHQVQNPAVGRIEVLGPDRSIVVRPGKTGLVSPARVEGRHIRIETCHDLDDIEPLADAVLRQRLKLVGEVQPAAQPHPPGVAQPQKGCAIGMFQVPLVGSNSQRAVAVEPVDAPVGDHLDLPLPAIQAGIALIRTMRLIPMNAGRCRGIPHAPRRATRPECGNAELLACRIDEHNVERDLVERIGVALGRLENELGHHVGGRGLLRCCVRRGCLRFGRTGGPCGQDRHRHRERDRKRGDGFPHGSDRSNCRRRSGDQSGGVAGEVRPVGRKSQFSIRHNGSSADGQAACAGGQSSVNEEVRAPLR